MLLATDTSKRGVEMARRTVTLLGAPERVTVLAVLTKVPEEEFDEFDEPVYSIEQQSRQWDAVIGEARTDLVRTASAFATAAHVETRIEAGDVARTIIDVAREIEADVIVVGDGTHARLRALGRRSVAERLLRGAPYAVLVVRGHDRVDP